MVENENEKEKILEDFLFTLVTLEKTVDVYLSSWKMSVNKEG